MNHSPTRSKVESGTQLLARRAGALFTRCSAIFLILVLLFSAVACNNTDESKNGGNTTGPSGQTADPSGSSQPVVRVTDADIPELEAYISSVVNGAFREKATFPDFTNVNQLPPVALAGSDLLKKATTTVGLTRMSRSAYEQYLQANLNPAITLPANANYQLAYDQSSDTFANNYEMKTRNFRPFSIFLDPVVTQDGENVYFDAYELAYEFVNAGTGEEERSNPVARMVVDDVTVGFSAPIARNDLHLIDHRQLAKTRFTLRSSLDGWNMISKTKLTRDESYKASALALFSDLRAVRGTAAGMPSGRLNVRNWASTDSSIVGTLDDGTVLWYVDCLPSTGYILGGPEAMPGVFNYDLGFGFIAKEYVG